jgi:hypothetical protein
MRAPIPSKSDAPHRSSRAAAFDWKPKVIMALMTLAVTALADPLAVRAAPLPEPSFKIECSRLTTRGLHRS